jgi:hypothetical protein
MVRLKTSFLSNSSNDGSFSPMLQIPIGCENTYTRGICGNYPYYAILLIANKPLAHASHHCFRALVKTMLLWEPDQQLSIS